MTAIAERCELRALAEQGAAVLDGAGPAEVLSWAGTTFGDRLAIASSMTDAVLAHLTASSAPLAKVLFLDTGYHFAERLRTVRAVTATLPLEVVTVRPARTVEGQDSDHGSRLFERDPDLCCRLRKVEPLAAALSGFDAWASGIRRDESPGRAGARTVEWDEGRGMVKVNPLTHWTAANVEAYIEANDVLVNPLVHNGFPSIGCAPCTRRVAPGEDGRAGRWAGLTKTECGLHT